MGIFVYILIQFGCPSQQVTLGSTQNESKQISIIIHTLKCTQQLRIRIIKPWRLVPPGTRTTGSWVQHIRYIYLGWEHNIILVVYSGFFYVAVVRQPGVILYKMSSLMNLFSIKNKSELSLSQHIYRVARFLKSQNSYIFLVV